MLMPEDLAWVLAKVAPSPPGSPMLQAGHPQEASFFSPRKPAVSSLPVHEEEIMPWLKLAARIDEKKVEEQAVEGFLVDHQTSCPPQCQQSNLPDGNEKKQTGELQAPGPHSESASKSPSSQKGFSVGPKPTQPRDVNDPKAGKRRAQQKNKKKKGGVQLGQEETATANSVALHSQPLLQTRAAALGAQADAGRGAAEEAKLEVKSTQSAVAASGAVQAKSPPAESRAKVSSDDYKHAKELPGASSTEFTRTPAVDDARGSHSLREEVLAEGLGSSVAKERQVSIAEDPKGGSSGVVESTLCQVEGFGRLEDELKIRTGALSQGSGQSAAEKVSTPLGVPSKGIDYSKWEHLEISDEEDAKEYLCPGHQAEEDEEGYITSADEETDDEYEDRLALRFQNERVEHTLMANRDEPLKVVFNEYRDRYLPSNVAGLSFLAAGQTAHLNPTSSPAKAKLKNNALIKVSVNLGFKQQPKEAAKKKSKKKKAKRYKAVGDLPKKVDTSGVLDQVFNYMDGKPVDREEVNKVIDDAMTEEQKPDPAPPLAEMKRGCQARPPVVALQDNQPQQGSNPKPPPPKKGAASPFSFSFTPPRKPKPNTAAEQQEEGVGRGGVHSALLGGARGGNATTPHREVAKKGGGSAIDYSKWDKLVDSDDEEDCNCCRCRALRGQLPRSVGPAAHPDSRWHSHCYLIHDNKNPVPPTYQESYLQTSLSIPSITDRASWEACVCSEDSPTATGDWVWLAPPYLVQFPNPVEFLGHIHTLKLEALKKLILQKGGG